MDPYLLALAIFAVALLYSSVGHAGASGYIALMALAGMEPQWIKPTALVLNIGVAALTSYHFWREGHFSNRLFWPLALGSIPWAFTGGYWSLPLPIFRALLGVVLIFAALRFWLRPKESQELHIPSRTVRVFTGSVFGLLAGLTGTGGGIFLTPWSLLKNWCRTKEAAALSAFFILANSLAGLAGSLYQGQTIPTVSWMLLVSALLGGALGSKLGSSHFRVPVLQRLLTVVLLIAGLKLVGQSFT